MGEVPTATLWTKDEVFIWEVRWGTVDPGHTTGPEAAFGYENALRVEFEKRGDNRFIQAGVLISTSTGLVAWKTTWRAWSEDGDPGALLCPRR